ncbi:MAG TPA: FkbM family methyltransferase, partial [Planctomycetota bacterium]|nr:FkbM family methyltransferase [Planctomycetota bacterium]
VERCDLLKLDCEGAEYDALLGAPRALLERIGRIVMEYHPMPNAAQTADALAAHLRAAGFGVAVSPSRKTPGQGLMFCGKTI